MQSLLYTIDIHATRKQVWETMLEEDTYKQWVKAFSDNPECIGEWKEGAEVIFFDPDCGGTVAIIDEFKPAISAHFLKR